MAVSIGAAPVGPPPVGELVIPEVVELAVLVVVADVPVVIAPIGVAGWSEIVEVGDATPLVKGSVVTDEAPPNATGCWLAFGSGLAVVLSGFKTL